MLHLSFIDLNMMFFLLILVLGLNYNNNYVKAEDDMRNYCFETRATFDIIPGQSFGTLPKGDDEKAYLEARCFRYFCKPHTRAGKGKFKCESLSENEKKFQRFKEEHGAELKESYRRKKAINN
jgi:hypothetical protein